MTVVDDRAAYASRERFPEASEVIAENFDSAMARLNPNESSYIVIVTRGHRDDMRVLRWAVQTSARYIGMIGSKRKTIGIFRELTKEGLAPALFDRVMLPVGLDIGAVTPEEIAVAITAELIAARRRVEREIAAHELVPPAPGRALRCRGRCRRPSQRLVRRRRQTGQPASTQGCTVFPYKFIGSNFGRIRSNWI